MIQIGTEYGGNTIPEDVLNTDSIVYSFGLGEDASFDIGILEKYGCRVHLFDPTPRSAKFYDAELSDKLGLLFYQIGLFSQDCSVKMFYPKDPMHVSCSIHNLQRTDTFFVANVKRLQSIMDMLKHDRIDLLKMDIEGAEFDVIDDMISCGIKPKVICVEFHRPCSEIVTKICNYGYKVLHSGGNEFVQATFVL